MKSGKITAAVVLAMLVVTTIPLVLAAIDSTSVSVTVDSIVAISVIQSISSTGDPGTNSGINSITIDNIGSADISQLEIRYYVTNLSSTSYNGTAFIMINANGSLSEDQQSYGKLYCPTMTSQPIEITATNTSYNIDRHGVLTLVYSTTSVDGTDIERAVQFGWTYNSSTDKVCIDIDADGDLGEELWRADGSTSIELKEHRYNSTGADTLYTVATVDLVSADTTAVEFKQTTGSFTDAGSLSVNSQKQLDYIVYTPNNVRKATYSGQLEFIPS